MTTKLSQGELLLPILKATLAMGKDEAHPYSEIAVKALASMSLTLDCMGLKPDGRALAFVPISNAGFSLRGRGLLTSEGRSWRLTALGVEVAEGRATMPKMPAPGAKAPKAPKPPKAAKAPKPPKAAKAPKAAAAVVEPAPAAVTAAVEPAPAAVEPAPVEVEPAPVEVVAVPVVAETPDEIAERLVNGGATKTKGKRLKTVVEVEETAETPEWVKDPYLRGLVAINTPCYGSWAPKAATCDSCPLSGYCRSAQGGALSVLAAKLKEAEVTKATAKMHTATAAAMSMTPTTPRVNATPVAGKVMKAGYDGLCVRTGSAIKAGDECYYVPGEGVVSAAAFKVGA